MIVIALVFEPRERERERSRGGRGERSRDEEREEKESIFLLSFSSYLNLYLVASLRRVLGKTRISCRSYNDLARTKSRRRNSQAKHDETRD